jgi:hypothetical protein
LRLVVGGIVVIGSAASTCEKEEQWRVDVIGMFKFKLKKMNENL